MSHILFNMIKQNAEHSWWYSKPREMYCRKDQRFLLFILFLFVHYTLRKMMQSSYLIHFRNFHGMERYFSMKSLNCKWTNFLFLTFSKKPLISLYYNIISFHFIFCGIVDKFQRLILFILCKSYVRSHKIKKNGFILIYVQLTFV